MVHKADRSLGHKSASLATFSVIHSPDRANSCQTCPSLRTLPSLRELKLSSRLSSSTSSITLFTVTRATALIAREAELSQDCNTEPRCVRCNWAQGSRSDWELEFVIRIRFETGRELRLPPHFCSKCGACVNSQRERVAFCSEWHFVLSRQVQMCTASPITRSSR